MLARHDSDSPSDTPVFLIYRELRKIRAEIEAIECGVIPSADGTRVPQLLAAGNDAWKRLAATPAQDIDDLVVKSDHCKELAWHDVCDCAYWDDGLVAPLCESIAEDILRLKCGIRGPDPVAAAYRLVTDELDQAA